jgi:hypothetical protein
VKASAEPLTDELCGICQLIDNLTPTRTRTFRRTGIFRACRNKALIKIRMTKLIGGHDGRHNEDAAHDIAPSNSQGAETTALSAERDPAVRSVIRGLLAEPAKPRGNDGERSFEVDHSSVHR